MTIKWSISPTIGKSILASLSRRLRKEINQKLRRMEKNYQSVQRRCMNQGELPQFLEQLFDLHTKRWSVRNEPGSFGLAARRQFYAEMGAQFLDRGWLEFWLLEFDGKPVATEFNFHFGNASYTLQNGFDPAFSNDSVGTVLKALILRDLISRGVQFYDFLGDSDPYKLRWKATTHSYLQRSCARPGSRGALYIKLTRGVAAARARLRTYLPESTEIPAHRRRPSNRPPSAPPPPSPPNRIRIPKNKALKPLYQLQLRRE